MFIRPRFFRERFVTECPGESMTEQSHQASCDINVIVERHARLGYLPPPDHPPQYADVTQLQQPLRDRIEFSERVIGIYDEALQAYVPEPPPAGGSGPGTVEPGEGSPS